MFSLIQQWVASYHLGVFDWLSCISYGLLALSYLMRDIKWLRIITLFACALDLVIYYQIRPGQPMWVQLFFSCIFIAINAVQLYVLWLDHRRTTFEGDEDFLFTSVFASFTSGEFRRLLKHAQFVDLPKGMQLMRHDEHADHIWILCRGELAIHLSGNVLNKIGLGAFIGEMGYLTQRPASVNVTATAPSKVLRINRKSLDTLVHKHPEVHAKLILIMGRDIADKLRKLNTVADDMDQVMSGFGASTFGPVE